MIVYKEVFQKLSDSGYSSYRLSKEKLISNATMNRLRHGESVSTNTIDTICRLCECQPGDILAWYADDEDGQE